MLRWTLIPLALAASALAVTAGAQRIRFQAAQPQARPYPEQPAFSPLIPRAPAMNFSFPHPFVANPQHPGPSPQPMLAPSESPFNPSSILKPQPPSRFIFMNPFYPYSPYAFSYPWGYAGPGYLPYESPYNYPYDYSPYGYNGYSGFWNGYQGVSPALPEQTPQFSAPPTTENRIPRPRLTNPAFAMPGEPPLPSQVAVTLDGRRQPEPSFAHTLTIGSGKHTLVISPRKSP